MKNNALLTVCLIDDDAIYRLITTRIIELVNPDKKVIAFKNGQHALDFFCAGLPAEEQLPDIIFLDINMPVMNGWEFLEAYCALKHIKKQIPIYMVSSSGTETDIIRSKGYSAVKDFLVKPICQQSMSEILA